MKYMNPSHLVIALLAISTNAQVLELHGSGTTNPSKCFWLLMDQIMDRAKPLMRLTYRAVGSSTGQHEFLGKDNTGTDAYVNINDFGSGDIPMSTENYNALKASGKEMVHLPFMMGAISFFHSIPGLDSDGIALDSCVLAKIFQRKIVFWDDDEILDKNPNLSLPYKNFPIKVAHRVLGSSSTFSITEYLHQSCPSEWPADKVGAKITWDEDTLECDSSSKMVGCLKDNSGTIGYADAGHALKQGLTEIALINLAGRRLSSTEALENGGVGDALVTIPSSADQDFGSVNPVNQDGDYTWPIVAISYIYVRKDLSFLQPDEQSLLKFFLTQLYTDSSIKQCEQFGFEIVPTKVREVGLAGINMLNFNANAKPWTAEIETQKGDGQGDYVISAKRKSYAEIVRDQNQYDVGVLMANKGLIGGFGETSGNVRSASAQSDGSVTFTSKEMGMIKAALGMGAASIVLWVIALGAFFMRRNVGSHSSESPTV